MCQGISELYERYVLRQIFYDNNINVFNINYDVISGEVKRLLDKIIDKGYKIVVKDLTLGNKIPVVGLLVFNSNMTRYAFSLGSDVDFDIALQRCITEMFQGEEFNFSFRYKMKNMKSVYNLKSIVWDGREKAHEYTSALIDKSGYIPYSILNEIRERNDIPSIFAKFNNNIEALDYNISICKKNEWDVFVKDFSYLGFPTYRVFIPGISAAFYVPIDNWMITIKKIEDFRVGWIGLSTKDRIEKTYFMDLLQDIYSIERYKCNSVPLNRMMKIIFDLTSPKYRYLGDIKSFLFKGRILNKEFEKAFEVVENDLLEEENYSLYINILNGGMNNWNEMGVPNCPRCKECTIEEVCMYYNYRDIVDKLKQKWHEFENRY